MNTENQETPVATEAAESAAVKKGEVVKAGRTWWFDAATFLWPIVVVAGALYWSDQRTTQMMDESGKRPPRVVVIDELALIQKVVREERIQDIDTVRTRVREVVKPYTDAGYVVIGEMNIVGAPEALVLETSDIDALYARSKQ